MVMKLGPVIKPDKWKKATSKKLDDDIKSANSDIIGHFLIYGWFGTIGKLDSGCWIPNLDFVVLTFSSIATFNLTETENRTKWSQTQLSYYWFE